MNSVDSNTALIKVSFFLLELETFNSKSHVGEGGNRKHDKHATRGGSAGRARAGGARVGDTLEIFARLLKNPTPHNFTFLHNLVDPLPPQHIQGSNLQLGTCLHEADTS